MGRCEKGGEKWVGVNGGSVTRPAKHTHTHTQHARAPFLQTATVATVALAGGVRGDGGHVLNAPHLHARAGQGAQGALGTRARGLGLVWAQGGGEGERGGEEGL